MTNTQQLYADWNPWHGCTKISPGCKYCYVYRQDEMYGSEKKSWVVTKNADFNKPVKRKRDKSYKIVSGTIVFTCFTSDFLVEGADEWRSEAWEMIRKRSDLTFFFFTKISNFPFVFHGRTKLGRGNGMGKITRSLFVKRIFLKRSAGNTISTS